jgi:hypothetical protein
MPSVMLHHEIGQSDWTHEIRQMAAIPQVGDYIALAWNAKWVRVYAVAHCPFEEAECNAEVFLAEGATSMEAIMARKPEKFRA